LRIATIKKHVSKLMKKILMTTTKSLYSRFALLAILLLRMCLPVYAQPTNTSNGCERLLMDFGWRFAFGHPFETNKDFNHGTGYFSYLAKAGYGDGAAASNFDDRGWRKLDLPHDWAVEQPFHPNASFSHGFKAIGRNFPDASVGWYRKSFSVPQSDTARRTTIEFDGVFRNATVWVNGHYLGTEPSGYNSFHYDITEYLNYGGDNVVAVRVDATMEEGWFYEGAGIYRHVWLSKTSPLHVVKDGTFVTTNIDNNNAVVHAAANIINQAPVRKSFVLTQSIVDADGKKITSIQLPSVFIDPFETKELKAVLAVKEARLWDLENPYLYKLVTTVTEAGKPIDSYETSFGIRTIRFDAAQGFFLNGKNIKLKGTNNHQDHAGVGTALPDELQYWRIKALKDMGSNAYRCSHHPPTPELLEACDRLGMLVIDENRLMRTTAGGLDELKKMIVRDRNHPSIISWSIGNEEWNMENNITGERVANTLQNFVKSLDTTRTTTAGISGGFRSGISSVLEVMGYNYLGNGDIDAHHRSFPNQAAMGTEEGSTFTTRGVYVKDDEKHYQPAYDNKPRPAFYSIQEGWKYYAERPWLAGIFYWTGFDYRGEPTPYGWPSITSYFGLMDLCGFPKDNAWYLQSWWQDKPVLHLLPHWNWKGEEGKEIDVWAYSNCDEVELFLNKKSAGRKAMPHNGHLSWKVKYAPGTVEAIGYKNGKRILNKQVQTTGSAAAIKLTPHRTSIKADKEDLSIVTVEVTDDKGRLVPTAGNEINFFIEGPGRIIGVGNGDPTSLEQDKFIENIETIAITNLKELPVEGMNDRKEIAPQFYDALWRNAFQGRTTSDSTKAYVYRGSFVLPATFAQSQVTFFYKSLGTKQSIYINGKPIGENIGQQKIGNEFTLDPSLLQAGTNTIAIIAEPIRKHYDWDNINTSAGAIQLLTKAQDWKRKLFNGMAQVIVQSTGGEGDIILTATSGDLKQFVLTIHAEPAIHRPAVDAKD
jgi:beta-galactosidase